ncbi:TonB-linked SusC/RagA family outer membrane protein [Filimonas zeae]|uniref:SusC/RagA family TonB-linked outer membrane protein n=1 Tax=Filimonas zeae TaxID=1737353 RepID=A0A917IN86_9BACT|nr:SusC/RagA family TonB-linked outer membrane protein [Filimonas zeae]MDR6337217.1 TonB-linked SusC/RagA family outer membrane protein [Filimonas zeae]GGH57541.1 SusC/RagA family TonB-linked outer membrane protein [Filimonas zeae]
MQLTTTITWRSVLLAAALSVTSAGAFAQDKAGSAKADTAVLKASGVIKDAATGKPLAGVNVSIPTFSAAITDDKGRFTIKVPDYNVTLFVSAEGVQTRQVPLRGKKEIAVRLYDESFESYYAPAVSAVSRKAAVSMVAPVTTIDPEGAWARNQETTDSYLQGLAGGLTAIRKSGTPGIGASLFMRGISSLYTTNKPLIVVDGVIYDNKEFNSSLISGHSSNPLLMLDIQDIDNITVIKDGSSTYGTKGGNGVIVITTATARQKATRIDVGVYAGVNFAPKQLPVMNAAQYRPYLADMLQSKGLTQQQILAQPYMTDDPANPDYARYHYNTNWQDKVLQGGASSNAYLKVSGGDNIATYALSMNYARNEGVIKNTDFSRLGTRFNAELNLSKKLVARSGLSFSYAEQNLQNTGIAPKVNPVYAALVKSPFMAQNDVSDKGDVSPNYADTDTLGYSNPVSIVEKLMAINKTYRFFGWLSFDYQLNSAFSISTRVGLTNDKVRENFFVPSKGIVHDTLQTAIANNRSGTQVKRLLSVYNDTRVAYKKTFSRIHFLEAQAGVRFQQQKFEQDYILGFNSATDELINVGYGAATLRQVGGDLSKNRWLNTYINGDYSFDNRVFINAGVTIDGSSRFGENADGGMRLNGVKYAVLPYAGVAWLLSSEQFMKQLPWVSMLKLRAGYTLAGNDDLGDYTARQYYTSQNLYGMQGLVRANIANPRLQWEVNRKMNLGVDMGFFDDRLRVSADVYQNTTDRMLVRESTPGGTGIDYFYSNSGKMRTRGGELAVNARVINSQQLKWDLGFSLAAYRNTVVKLPQGDIVTPFAGGEILTREGKAANLFYGYKTNGVYATDADAAGDSTINSGGALAAFGGGDMRFVNINGDKRIDKNDRQVIGNPNPDFTGSITTVLNWKRFTLNALFTFSKGNDVYNYTRSQLESGAGYNNQLLSMLNRWRVQGQVTHIPKATWGDPLGNARFSDRWIEDGSYFRLRNISLAYNVKIKTGFLQYMTVYVSANNVFTITRYLGYDPEFSATESPLGQGVDIGLQPQIKSAQAGIRLGL